MSSFKSMLNYIRGLKTSISRRANMKYQQTQIRSDLYGSRKINTDLMRPVKFEFETPDSDEKNNLYTLGNLRMRISRPFCFK